MDNMNVPYNQDPIVELLDHFQIFALKMGNHLCMHFVYRIWECQLPSSDAELPDLNQCQSDQG